jgi:ABC-type sugar transport system ATPase subunit
VLLRLEKIQKRFGGVHALKNGNLEVRAGEIHLLLGENGAGKSTLMKIVAGMQTADAGDIVWKDRKVTFRRPAEAAQEGIAMVHQESLLAPHLSVAENIFLGREERRPFGWVNRRRMMERAAKLIKEHRFPLDPEWRVGKLSPAGKQLVEICRAIQHGSSLLIFDEPTSSLSESETREVFRIVRTLCERNVGVIYITHRLEELRKVGDRLTILRDGITVHTGEVKEITTDGIIQHMVGREVASIYEREPVPPGNVLLEVRGVSRAKMLADISFEIRAGEIVGLAGLVGAGRTELCRSIFGLDRRDAGSIRISGVPVHIGSPRDAVRAGLALIPEDRQHAGLATALSVGYNVTMAGLRQVSPGGFIRHREENRLATEYIQRLRIRAESPKQRAGRLSGGNQQKVAIAKWVLRRARVLLFDEPTRGIDVGAKREVFQLMDELARQGAAILMVSSELPELVQVPDRILVMRNGRITASLPRGATQEDIMRYATVENEK